MFDLQNPRCFWVVNMIHRNTKWCLQFNTMGIQNNHASTWYCWDSMWGNMELLHSELVGEATAAVDQIKTAPASRSSAGSSPGQHRQAMQHWLQSAPAGNRVQGRNNRPMASREATSHPKGWHFMERQQAVGAIHHEAQCAARCHDTKQAGHFGFLKTLQVTRRQFWWPWMKAEIETHVKGCPVSAATKQRTGDHLASYKP